MTLGRRGREAAPRPEPEDAGWRSVEVEELTPQRVTGRARNRRHALPLLAIVPVIALLAVGLGFFGGRKGPRSGDVPGRTFETPGAGSQVAARSVGPAFSPIARASRPCRATADTAPAAYLEIDGVDMPPLFDELDTGDAEEAIDTASDFGLIPEDLRTEVPSDARVFIGVAEDACALGWTLALAQDGHLSTIGQVLNPARDPRVAQQNRFELPLAQFRGGDYALVARLAYANAVRQHAWPIRVLPFELPDAQLHIGHVPVDVVPGCDVRLELRNGYQEQLSHCPDALLGLPRPATAASEPPLTFDFGAGWLVQALQIECGTVDSATLTFAVTGSCASDERRDARAWTFHVTDVVGVATLAIEGCALESGSGGANEVCGTWYATLNVAS